MIQRATIFVAFTIVFSFHCVQAQPIQKSAASLQVIPDALNFIVMGDWGRNGEDHQKPVAIQMGKIAATVGADFVIATGDNFYPRGVVSEFDPHWKYSYEDIYTAFSLQWDWYPVLGNHDYGANPDAQVAYSKISRRWQMPARYYAKKFSLQGDTLQQVLIAFIDTTPLISSYYKGKGHAVHGQDSTAQIRWLEHTLADTSSIIKWKLVVGHHPVNTGGGRTNSPDTKSIYRVLAPLFKKYHVDAYLSGHEHSLQHIAISNACHQFISGSASEKTPARMLPESKYAASAYGFMLFSLLPKKMTVQAIGDTGAILYTTTIHK